MYQIDNCIRLHILIVQQNILKIKLEPSRYSKMRIDVVTSGPPSVHVLKYSKNFQITKLDAD